MKAPNRHLFKRNDKIVFVCTSAKPNQPQRLVCNTMDIKMKAPKRHFREYKPKIICLSRDLLLGSKKCIYMKEEKTFTVTYNIHIAFYLGIDLLLM
jgi:hypothetical protein